MTRGKTASGPLVLRYDLYSLPTAQHKAGLAGLILMVESMKARHLAPLPKIRNRSPGGAEIEFTPDNLQAVFNDLFDASWVEVPSRSKWSGKTPKRIEAKSSSDGKKGEDKRYIYDAVRPEGRFLQTYYPDGDGIWVKLWRDMLWSTLRGRPTTRGVYKERADLKPSSESAKVWRLLAKATAARAKGRASWKALPVPCWSGPRTSMPRECLSRASRKTTSCFTSGRSPARCMLPAGSLSKGNWKTPATSW